VPPCAVTSSREIKRPRPRPLPARCLPPATDVDHTVPLSGIAPLLDRLTREEVPEKEAAAVSEEMETEATWPSFIPRCDSAHTQRVSRQASAARSATGPCGSCRTGELVRYRCRVGRAYSRDSLPAQQSKTLEVAFWSTLRALEERAALATRLAHRSRQGAHDLAARRFEEQAADARQRADLIRQALMMRASLRASATSSPEIPQSVSSAGGGTTELTSEIEALRPEVLAARLHLFKQ
jgi:hypothetical protein